MSQVIISTAQRNLDHFKLIKTQSSEEFVKIFGSIIDEVKVIDQIEEEIKAFAPKYDFDENSPGNGYRTFIYVYEKALIRTLNLCLEVRDTKSNRFFAKTYFEKWVRY